MSVSYCTVGTKSLYAKKERRKKNEMLSYSELLVKWLVKCKIAAVWKHITKSQFNAVLCSFIQD